MTKTLSKEFAFNGRLRTSVDGASIGPNDFQVLKNLRYTDTNVRGVQGHTKINAAAAPETAIRNLFHFRKDQPVESHVLIDANLKVYDCTAAVPGTGSVIATPLYTDLSGATTGRYAVAPNGMVARCTGKEALLYGGTEYGNIFFIDNPTASNVWDYTDQIRNTLTDAANLATLHTVLSAAPALSATAATAVFYVGSPLPIDKVKFYVATGTGKPTGMIAKYWQGSAWAAVGSPVDGTSGLQATGNNWFSFASTVDTSKQKNVEKVLSHWYQFTVTATADFDSVPKVSRSTVSVPMQKIQDLWDGAYIPCAAFIVDRFGDDDGTDAGDYTSNVFDPYMGVYGTDKNTYAPVGPSDLSASGFFLAGFQEPVCGVAISIPPVNCNTNNESIDYLAYWNGSAWVDITSTVEDGTKNGAKTMNKSGWITWPAPAQNVEKPITNRAAHNQLSSTVRADLVTVSDGFPLYYYRVGFSGTLSNVGVGECAVYHVGGIRAQRQIGGYTFADQYAGRLMLCDNVDEARNSVRYSAYQTANVFNGDDSDIVYFGGDEAIVATAPIYNRYGSTETNTFVVCKRGETWVLSGDDPTKWIKFQVSNNIGCVAPRSMVPINLSPKESTQQVSYNAAVWVSARGVEVFAGGSISLASGDIDDLFDPSKSTYLGAAVIPTITAFYDPILSEYHMIVPGSAEYVWDTKRNKWFQIVRGTELYGGVPVADSNGYRYCYGYGNAGYVFRLENGATFDGTAIAHTLRTGDMAFPEGSVMEWSQVDWFNLIAKAKTITAQNVAMVYFNDTQAASYGATTVSPLRSGYRLINGVVHNKDLQSTFHGFQFSISTTDETTGFEPLYLAIRYRVFPRELS